MKLKGFRRFWHFHREADVRAELDMDRGANKRRIRGYLLHDLSEDERAKLEEDFFQNDELFELVSLIEDELVDEYVAGELPASAGRGFQAQFLTSPEGLRKVEIARAIRRAAIRGAPAPTPQGDSGLLGWISALPDWSMWRLASEAAMMIAAVGVLILGWTWMAPRSSDPGVVSALRDTSGEATLRGDRSVVLAALGTLPPALAGSVDELLTHGRARLAPGTESALEALRPEANRGTPRSAGAEPVPLSPVLTGVRSEQPTLRWRQVPSAREYGVTLADVDRRPVWRTTVQAQSEVSVPAGALQRGRVYFWQVEASVEGEPVAGQAAGFWLIDSDTLQRVEGIERSYQGSALVRASIYAQHGLFEEALAQVDRLGELNPQNQQVRRMRDYLQGRLGRQ